MRICSKRKIEQSKRKTNATGKQQTRIEEETYNIQCDTEREREREIEHVV